MKKIGNYRLRKCSDIELDSVFYEVIDSENNILFDVSKSDGDFEILFYPNIADKSISIELLSEAINEVKELFDTESGDE